MNITKMIAIQIRAMILRFFSIIGFTSSPYRTINQANRKNRKPWKKRVENRKAAKLKSKTPADIA